VREQDHDHVGGGHRCPLVQLRHAQLVQMQLDVQPNLDHVGGGQIRHFNCHLSSGSSTFGCCSSSLTPSGAAAAEMRGSLVKAMVMLWQRRLLRGWLIVNFEL
jgi:hypothetical protein